MKKYPGNLPAHPAMLKAAKIVQEGDATMFNSAS
jgi:hypothetical protein